MTYVRTYAMEQSPSWEANRLSASQEIPPHFMEPERSSPHSQAPATSPYPEPARSSTYPQHPSSWRSILILSSHPRLDLPSGLFPSGFPTNTHCNTAVQVPCLRPNERSLKKSLWIMQVQIISSMLQCHLQTKYVTSYNECRTCLFLETTT